MKAPRHVLFTGGGSAGHVVPNIPLIAHFLAAGSKVSYVGSEEGPERGLITPLGVPFHAIRSGQTAALLVLEATSRTSGGLRWVSSRRLC